VRSGTDSRLIIQKRAEQLFLGKYIALFPRCLKQFIKGYAECWSYCNICGRAEMGVVTGIDVSPYVRLLKAGFFTQCKSLSSEVMVTA